MDIRQVMMRKPQGSELDYARQPFQKLPDNANGRMMKHLDGVQDTDDVQCLYG